jgi:alcohol dehydrogenase
MCAKHVSSACREVPRTSTYGLGKAGGDWGGALADAVLVPYADFMLAPVPDGVSLRQAASASDNVADAYRCVMPHLANDPGAPVLVAGNGAIPLIAADAARRLGASDVSLYSQQAAVLARAEAVGISAFEVAKWPPRFPTHPITVDCTSDPDGLRAVIASTEAGGHCTAASMHFSDVAVPMFMMYMKGVTLHTSRTQGASVLPRMLDAIAQGAVDPLIADPLIASWDDAPDALLAGALKTIVERAAA